MFNKLTLNALDKSKYLSRHILSEETCEPEEKVEFKSEQLMGAAIIPCTITLKVCSLDEYVYMPD